MNDVLRLQTQILTSPLQPAIDLSVLITFFGFGAVYLLVPVLGYRSDRRGSLAIAMYLLIAYVALTLLQLLAIGFEGALLFGQRMGQRDEWTAFFLFVFAFLKTTVFVLAMVAFVVGLRSLHLRPPAPPGRLEESDEMRR